MPKEKSSNTTKKILRKEISSQVENALPQLKALLGADKFEARLKKAVKILSEDLPVQQPEVKVKATLPKKEKAVLPKKEKAELPKKGKAVQPKKEKEVKEKAQTETPQPADAAEVKKPETAAAKKAAVAKPKAKSKKK